MSGEMRGRAAPSSCTSIKDASGAGTRCVCCSVCEVHSLVSYACLVPHKWLSDSQRSCYRPYNLSGREAIEKMSTKAPLADLRTRTTAQQSHDLLCGRKPIRYCGFFHNYVAPGKRFQSLSFNTFKIFIGAIQVKYSVLGYNSTVCF